MDDAIRWSELSATLWAMRRTRKQARKGMPSELLPSSFPKDAMHARERTLQGLVAEPLQSSPPKEAERALKRALTRRPSELCHGSHCKGDQPPPNSGATRQAGHPRLRIIQDPISRLNPEMLYRQIQYLVEEGDWAQHGEEVPVEGQVL